MVEALKKMDKKFLIMAGIILFLPIFIIILLAILRGCDSGSVTHENYEEKMIKAAEKYISISKKVPNDEGEFIKIKLSKLISDGYIKSTEKLLDDDTCDGYITVRRNGSSIEKNNGGFLNYLPVLECKEYKTPTLTLKIKEQLVTSGTGLYDNNGRYIFRGDKAKNYIDFYGRLYRIMSIEKDGSIKLIKSEPEGVRAWDNKYNKDVDKTYGKNIYKDSLILTYLLNDYTNPKKFSTKSKQHIIAHDVCIGKRDSNDLSINLETDCSQILEKQLISLINISEYSMASLDENCTSINSKSCNNYNYLLNVASSTWTTNAIANNSYDVLFIANGLVRVQSANQYNEYNAVIYIDGNEKCIEGTGSLDNPYILK